MENIQVLVRIRPSNGAERDSNDLEIWSVMGQDTITITNDRFNDLVRMRKFVPGQRVEFTFNQCFEQKHGTTFLYKQQIQRIVLSALQGINGTVFMYGQTGSGKTFTMMGPEVQVKSREGVLPLALKDVFDEIAATPDKQFFLRCSYVEIYTDQVYDLLATQERMTEVLQINEDFNREFVIKGATEEIVNTVDDIMDILTFGETNRHYASTIMNHCSSRSHTIFRLYVRCVPNVPSPSSMITESILNFVDLAGSEKINIHDSMLRKRGTSAGGTQYKERQNESKHINKSLFFLTQVISLRSQGKSDLHIPYRNSPLTKILRSSLGGNSRTAIILCVNPCYSQFEQTLSTLRFGMNAKKIENNVTKNVVGFDNDEQVNRIISEYETKIHNLEMAREEDKNQAEQMIQFIQKLEEQRKYFKAQFNASDHITKIMQKKDSKYEWVHLNYPNIGILWVPQHKEQNQIVQVIDEFEIIRKCKNFQDENVKLQGQIQILEAQLTEHKLKQVEVVTQTKKRYQQQKNKTNKYKNLFKDQQEERNKYLKLALLFHNQVDMEELILLSHDNLDAIMNNLSVLMQNIVTAKVKKENKGSSDLRTKITPIIRYPKYFFDTSPPSVQFWDADTQIDMKRSEIDSFQSYFQSQNLNQGSPSEVQSSIQQFKEPFKHICSHEKSTTHRVYNKENFEGYQLRKNGSVPEVSEELKTYFK